MGSRSQALVHVGTRTRAEIKKYQEIPSERFGSQVFNRKVMKKTLSPKVYQHVINIRQGKCKLNAEHANTIAEALKKWAIKLGATHYTHWFLPLTNMSAEKHDAFIDWDTEDAVIEKFSGKQLIQGEPDASSFPSGGLRSTFEARGYTGWDPCTPPFVWQAEDGVTLFIPSIFFSWTGDILDAKIPLLRSEEKLQQAIKRLFTYTGTEADYIYSTLGLEQEYFVVDRALRDLRPDLVMLGKTVFGASPSKGQELQDHYFGSVQERVLSFMHDVEQTAIALGIPLKTRHNEVAPAQHEVAPVFEPTSLAVDHNIILMELMRQKAARHGLSCLLHEKPFAHLNGSGKHANWSICTDRGDNLLDPEVKQEGNIQFLILLTAVLEAVHQNAAVLRASIGSYGNDCRLGGHEAPPAIISVYLGNALEAFLEDIECRGEHKGGSAPEHYDLGIMVIPKLHKDNTDRNRTSPFAFTGNKFEFRAVGSSANCALPITVLNTAIASSLNNMIDQIEDAMGGKGDLSVGEFSKKALPVIQTSLKQSKSIRFKGDNYSIKWEEEAKSRGLEQESKSINAYKAFLDPKTIKMFDGVLSKLELKARYEIFVENYIHLANIEALLMVDLFRTRIFPAAMECQRKLSVSILEVQALITDEALFKPQIQKIEELAKLLSEATKKTDALEVVRNETMQKEGTDTINHLVNQMIPLGEQLRDLVDQLEGVVEDELWPLPKYSELLFYR